MAALGHVKSHVFIFGSCWFSVMFCKNDSGMHSCPAVGVKWPMCQELKCQCAKKAAAGGQKLAFCLLIIYFDSAFWADVTFNSQCVQSSATAYIAGN